MATKHARIFRIVSAFPSAFYPVLRKKYSPNSISCRSLFTSKLCEGNMLKDHVLKPDYCTQTVDMQLDSPSSMFVNRNPRNPEYFGYNKQRGYSTQYKKRNFFKRLNLVISNRHIKAFVEDQDGNILVQASTEEFDITRHLYKPNDVTAALNIGRVIAERCLQAGVNRVSMYTTDIRKKEKYQEFRKALSAGGVEMTEPSRVIPPQTLYTGISVKKKRKGIIGMTMNNSTKRKFT